MAGARVSVVTGATSGIGRALALGLARRGDLVVAVGRDAGRLADLADALHRAGPHQAHRPLRLDVASPADMDSLHRDLQGLGRADLLIASAAVGRGHGAATLPPPTARLPLADWQAMLDVNLTGAFLANKAVIPLMRAQGDGDIVNIGSSTTPRGLRGTALAPGYGATKFALAEMGRQLAHELGPDGIRVRTIFPGPVETPLIADTLLDGPFGGRMSAESFAEALFGLIELGRTMDVQDPHLLPMPSRRRRAKNRGEPTPDRAAARNTDEDDNG